MKELNNIVFFYLFVFAIATRKKGNGFRRE